MNTKYNVVLFEENPPEAEVYSDLIQQAIFCKLDVVWQMEEFVELIKRLVNPLVVISHPTHCLDFLKSVKKVSPEATVILISGSASVEEAVSAIKMGAEDYFAKPLKIESFQFAVRKGIERGLVSKLNSIEYVDDVTGLYNSRYLNTILNREIQESEINHKTFCVLFIDADQFKSVNDSYGHIVGTKLLNELGSCLKKHVREKDTVFRYGGDEFVAVLVACDLVTAEIVAERIRLSVEKETFLRGDRLNIHVTISIGIALYPDHATTQNGLIEAADRAMYEAKNAKKRGKFGRRSKLDTSSL